MKIQPTVSCVSNNSERNFKAVNIVQVPKSAFKEPENVAACMREFSGAINRVTDNRLNIFRFIKSLFTGCFHKTDCILESLSYFNAKCAMQYNKLDYSINWLKNNTGLPVKEPLNREFHSFIVCTKEHNPMIKSSVKKALNNSILYIQEGRTRYPSGEGMIELYAATKLGVEAQKLFDKRLTGIPVKKFEIKKLEDIKDITKKLDI